MNKFIKTAYIEILRKSYYSREMWSRRNLDSDEWEDFLDFLNILYIKRKKKKFKRG